VHRSCPSVCPYVCRQNAKSAIFSKTKQFRAMVSINDPEKVVHGLFNEPIIGPLKSKMAEIRHLGSWRQNAKTRFSEKLSNLELWCLLTTYRKLCKLNWAFQRTHYWIPTIQDGWDPPSWKSTWHHFFCRGWSDFDKISETGAEWHVDCGDVWKWKPDVEFQYGRRLGEFSGMSSQSHMPHCRVQSPDEINVVIVPHCRV